MAEIVKKSSRTSTPAKPRKTATKKNAATEVASNNHHHTVSQQEVAQLAHRYWIERGRPHGGHEEDWFRAERELCGRD